MLPPLPPSQLLIKLVFLFPISNTPHFTMVTACDVPAGVITGDDVKKLLKHAKDNGYAIPAFNCTRCVSSRILW
jgi:hypothetical protein